MAPAGSPPAAICPTFSRKAHTMPINVIVCGAAGRMGKLLVTLVREHPETQLVGAIEAPGHSALGKDVGEVAGIGALEIKVADDYGAAAASDTVTLDFTV